MAFKDLCMDNSRHTAYAPAFVVLYVPGLLFNTPIKVRFTAALIAFVINYACYFPRFTAAVLRAFQKVSTRQGRFSV